jgi:hypothetical protein
MVETPSGTFNASIDLQSYLGGNAVMNVGRGGSPNLNDGYVYLWPLVAVNGGNDRVYGLLKNCFMVGSPLSAGQQLTTDATDYVCVGITNTTGTARGSLAVRTR